MNIRKVGDVCGVCYDLYIGRPSKWGNPFRIGPDGNRRQVLEKYEAYVESSPELLAALPELAGLRLACFCDPRPCHGHVLVKLYEKYCT